MLRTCQKLFISLIGSPMFFIKELLLKPAISIPCIVYPAWGTFSISIFPLALTNSISIDGCSLRNACAIATAGKICPPVPPPAIIIFLFTDMFFIYQGSLTLFKVFHCYFGKRLQRFHFFFFLFYFSNICFFASWL